MLPSFAPTGRLRPPPRGRLRLRVARRGNVLIGVLMLLVGLGVATIAFYLYHAYALRTIQARSLQGKIETSAQGVARVMTERLIATAGERLGAIDQAALDSLTRAAWTVPLPAGLAIDTAGTRYVVTRIAGSAALPYDVDPLAFTSDQPRFAFDAAPPVAGRRTFGSTEVTVVATVTSARLGRRTAMQTVALAKVPPFQHVIATAGDLELCAQSGSRAEIAGAVRAEGSVVSQCPGDRVIAGSVYARDDIVVRDGAATLVWDGGSAALPAVTRDGMRQNPGATLGAADGRARSGAALGDWVIASAFQDAATAGSGECPDFAGACAGTSSYFPSLELQRTTTGPGGEFTIRCGYSYRGQPCTGVATGVTYRPYPFAAPPAAGTAAADPATPTQLWRGLLPDARREDRCTATVAGASFRTYRCPTNPYGYVIDLSRLPPVPGGLLAIRKASSAVAGANASGMQEAVLLTNGTTLAGPLTIFSELPVYIQGSFNTVAPVPAMIDAPLITVVPAEAAQQLQTALVWDSTAAPGAQPLRAFSPVTVRAVLRSPYHPTPAGGAYYGGTLEQIPAVLGDWSAVSLSVIGAVEGRAVSVGAAGSYSVAFRTYGAEPADVRVRQPRVRRVLFDQTLLTAAGQPRGSWYWENLPPAGAGGTRTADRQRHAVGGFSIARLVLDLVNAPAPGVIPAGTAVGTAPTAAPTASFTVSANPATVGQAVTFDGGPSIAPNGSIRTFFWDFGDGTTGTGAQVTKTFTRATAADTVRLTVVDNVGMTHTVARSLQIVDGRDGGASVGGGTGGTGGTAPTYLPITAAFTVAQNPVYALDTEGFDGRASADPNAGGMIVAWTWEFGDGTTGTGPVVTHVYADSGTYAVRLTVRDNYGVTASVVQSLRVVKQWLASPQDLTAPVWVKVAASVVGDPPPGSTVTGSHITFAGAASSVYQVVSSNVPAGTGAGGFVEQTWNTSNQKYQEFAVDYTQDGHTMRFLIAVQGQDNGVKFTQRLSWTRVCPTCTTYQFKGEVLPAQNVSGAKYPLNVWVKYAYIWQVN